MISREIKKKFTDVFDSLTQRHSRYKVWSDFVIMTACAISNAVDKRFFDEREKMYLNCISGYTKEEVEKISEMAALVFIAFERNSNQDFLGVLYSELGLNNGRTGQFFTPYNVSEMMAKIVAGELIEDVKSKGKVKVSDPCCGAGCLLLAYANVIKDSGVNYQHTVMFMAQDIDMIAALMCYIQLSVIGCSAIIKVGNSLTEPITENEPITDKLWFTPMYRLGNSLLLASLFENSKNTKLSDTA